MCSINLHKVWIVRQINTTWILVMQTPPWLAALNPIIDQKSPNPVPSSPCLPPPIRLSSPSLPILPPDFAAFTDFSGFGPPSTLTLAWSAFRPPPSFQRRMLHYFPSSGHSAIFLTIPYDTIPSGATAYLCQLAIAFDDATKDCVQDRALSDDDLILLWGRFVARTHDQKSCFHEVVSLTPTLRCDNSPRLDHIFNFILSRSTYISFRSTNGQSINLGDTL